MRTTKVVGRVLRSAVSCFLTFTLAVPANLWFVASADASTSVRVAAGPTLNTPRVGHSATALPDGRVVIAGGENADGPLASVEVLDPVANVFVAAGALTAPRAGHTATRLSDGRLLIAGGRDANGALATAEIYDPADGSATPVAAMSAPRSGHAATRMPDGKVLISGGDQAGTAELFDPATGTFAVIGTMTAPRAGHTASLFQDGTVLLAGGGNDTAEFVDPVAQTFTAVAQSMTAVRTGHGVAATADEALLLIGGDADNTVERLDAATETFALAATLGNAIETATLLANDQVLVLGPASASILTPAATLSVADVADAAALMRTGATATELTDSKQILVAGGRDASNELVAATAVYNPAWVATDQDDYSPFTYVYITGGGFLPGETVSNQIVQVKGPAAGTAYDAWVVVADASGNFTTDWLVFTEDLLFTTLDLTSRGQASGLSAKTTFTDAGKGNVTQVTIESQTGQLTCGTAGSATFTMTATCTVTGTGNNSYTWNVTGSLPTGASLSYAVSQSRNGAGTLNNTLTVNTTSATPAGTYSFTARCTGDAGGSATANGTFIVQKGTPTVTVTVGSYSYNGSPQGPTAVTMSPTSSGAVTWSYVGVSGTSYGPSATRPTLAGSYTATATVAADSNNNQASSSATAFAIGKATPVITWGNPASIAYGTALSGTQLNATANVPGGLAYNPASGVVLNAGNGQSLSVTFTPDDPANYATATKTVLIDVTKVTPTVTAWPTASAITLGQALSLSTLSGGSASVPGSFAFTNPSTTPNSAGTSSAAVTFTPADATNYYTVDGTVDVLVATVPVIQGSPSVQAVMTGDIVTFTASATATPAPAVQWEVNSGSGWNTIGGATSTSYTFASRVGDHGKQYRAKFTNVAGTEYSNPAGVSVSSEVTPKIQVTRSGYTYNRTTRRYVQTLTLQNTSSTTIESRMSLVLDGLSGATVFQPTGTTSTVSPTGAGRPYKDAVVSLAPGATVKVGLEFENTNGLGIAYNARCLAGPNAR